jgi:membrane associated rhomboid family serine protease
MPSLLFYCCSGQRDIIAWRLLLRPLRLMSAARRSHPVTQRSEPIFNIPSVVVGTAVVLVLVHGLRMFALTDAEDRQFLLTFAFLPLRYTATAQLRNVLPGGFGADLWTPITYAFLHGDLLHIGFNLAWLLPFGSALARRFGAWRYGAFMLVMSAAGALAYFVSDPHAPVPMIGASGAISGAMAAAMRFVFQPGGPLGLWRDSDDNAYRVPAASLAAMFRDLRFLAFIGTWLGLNVLLSLANVSIGGVAGQEIAWQAHLGGFLAGLLLFGLFDPAVPQSELDTRHGG